MCEGKRIKKKKTSVKKSTLNPVYNEAMVFDVPQENVEDVYLAIKVIDYDRWVDTKNITKDPDEAFFIPTKTCCLISPRKHMLLVLIRSASTRRF